MAPARSRVGPEIHRRLSLGEPDDIVAEAVGLKPRIIRWHKAERCKNCGPLPDRVDLVDLPPVADAPDAAPAPAPAQPVAVDLADPVAVAWAAYTAGVSLLGLAAAYGLDVAQVDADAPDFGLNGAAIAPQRLVRLAAKADALERMRKFRPAQWAKLVAGTEEAERKAALSSRLPRETWVGFWTTVAGHQSALLSETDLQAWFGWISDLVAERFPEMA